MRLPNTAHTSRPWRIHELTPDFDVEDVWALATPGGKDELPRLVSLIASGDFPYGAPVLVRTLWEARWKIGALLGWDSNDTGIGSRVNSLRDRLPSDLRAAPRGPDFAPFTSVFHSSANGRRSWPTGQSTRSCTSAGCRRRPAATAARWRSWSSPTDRSALPTWAPSSRFDTWLCIRHSCAGSSTSG